MRPSLENLPKSIAALDPRKQRLLALLLKEEGIDPLRAPIVPVAREAGAFPLSFAQERLWFIEQLQPGNVAYNLPSPLRVKGPLDPAVLRRTFAEIVRRHETLRTTFAAGPAGHPVQVVAPPGPVALPFVDLAALPAARREDEARRVATEDAVRPFDLARGPILRLALLRLGGADHVVLATVHHIASDGWSTGILVREVMALYAAFSQGWPSPLPELPIQYVDFASWQRQTLQGEVLERELAYWRRQLGGPAGPPAVLEISTDRPRPAVAGFLGGAERTWLVEGDGVERAKALARESGATLFMLVLAAFEALLARYTGQSDVTVGTPVANRQRTEVEDLIGFFVNTLVLRGDLGGDPTFREVLLGARRVATEAFSHQDLPFSKLVEELNPERSLAHSPFFQVTCSVANLPPAELSMSGLAFEAVGSDQPTATFDLNLSVVDNGGALLAQLEHRADLWDGTTVHRMLGHLATLLAAALDDPDRRLSALPLLTPAERQELVEWNDTAAAYAGPGVLHALVAAQAARTPDAVAVAAGSDALTYRELDRRAAVLARRLQGMGVGPDVPVAVLMERSRELMVALLSVLKAGGAYLPLDPAHPAERLAAALADAAGEGPAVVLTQERFVALAPAGSAVLALDRDASLFLGEEGPSGPAARPDHLAYVIFTSGSTGRPKGAMNTHRAIANRLLWMQETYGLTAADRVLQKTPFTFDVSVWELFWPLMTGARLVMAEPGGHADPAYLLRAIEEEGITTVHFVPSMLAAFLNELGDAPAARCPSLRRVIASGEALLFHLTRRFFSRGLGAGAELHNLYGPTEAAVDVTAWACEREPRAPLVPIGRPVANTAIHLLDADLRPVPVGVPGELYIAGVQPARGYAGRPELTAERFVPDPFAASPGARAYRTGDLARRLPGGEIDYLGRLDHQVKIRGLRIELGEIEAEMARFPGVAEAVVVTAPGPGGDPRLVAFAVPDGERAAPVARRLRLEASGELAGRELALLPNGLPVAQRNRGETEFLFREIFGERVYLRHGIALRPGAVVFDVGANIGLFSLFARQAGAGRIYAFEPIPEVFADLRANALLHALPAHLFDCGLADEAGTAEFAYYPHATLLSSRFGDAAEERGVVRELLETQGAALGEDEMEELLALRVRPERVTCRLRTLSEVMRAERVERIDLLKVDVEKSELAVLQGIEPADWPRIGQVVVEVRDSDGRLGEVTGLLAARGFAVEVEQDQAIASAGLYNVYARRPNEKPAAEAAAEPASPPDDSLAWATPEAGDWASADAGNWTSADALLLDLRAALARRLPEHMIPGSIVLLPALPVNANGKADRKALAARTAADRPEAALLDAAHLALAAPRTALEELIAAQWAELLGLDRVPRDASFFDLGGHSLLATQALSRLRQEPGVDLPLRALFAAPTVAGLAAAVEAELGGRAGDGAQPAVRPPLRPRAHPISGEERLPLSFAQERLWFVDQMAPGSPAYNVPSAVRLAGRLSIPVLAACFAEIVRRHETLRTRFATDAQGPVQVVLPPAPPPLPRIDLRALPAARREAELLSLAQAEAARPFDLAAGPMLRVTLAELGAEDHAALFTMHHIASDAWSMGVLVQELAALYPAFLAGRPSPLPPLPVQYADFALWQRGWLAGEALDAEIRWWRDALAGAPVVLELPADHPRPAVQTSRGAVRSFMLPPAAAAGARRLAREGGATVFIVALAAFDAWLHRITGQGSLLVGSTIANRTRRELEELIGFFVNTLALRSDLAAGESFQQLLDRTRERALAAYGHQDLPFERLVELLAPERDPSRPPLVQVLLQLQNAPMGDLELPGLALSPLATGTEAAKFDLVVNLVEAGGEIGGHFLYNADLFDATTVERWVGAYARLLAAAVENVEGAVAGLPLLAPAERHELLDEWGGASARFPVDGSLHGRFAARAAAASTATAAVCDGERLSYGDLEARANRLANHLLARGVEPGSLVGLCLPRSLDLPMAILGVLKAGCAYVPLDPDYPAERLSFLLADSRAAALVTRSEVAPGLPDRGPRPPLVLLDAEASQIAHASGEAPRVPASPRDLAYVIYTSGSTGRPKGVLVEHGHVLRLFAATDDWFGFGPGDVWTLFHSYAFDFSVWEIWGALLYGGRLVVVPYAVSRSPADFRALLARERATVLSQTPSAFRQLVWADEGTPAADLADLRLVVFGGEALEPASLLPWIARHGDAHPRLVNMYGITETTVHVTYRVMGRVVEDRDLGSAASPIGRPIPDLAVHVVDAGLQPLPIGVPGEMLVGGAGVARGYLGRPELTAERFVPDLFGGEGGSRVYRSGDLARWLPSGELAYLGRIDQQVKVRGFRVELGEIQAALAAHPAVREAAVLAGDDRLVAYLAVGDPAGAPSPAELRSFLSATLPEHMLPAAFVTLPALPLTPHGKVDRRALAGIAPAEAGTRAGAGGGYEAPRDGLERFLAGLFQEALKVERVGVHDGFFELGGNSIAGAVLVNRLQQELGEIVQVVVIFDAPTVAQLALYLRREHPRAIARRWGTAAGAAAAAPSAEVAGRVDLAKAAELRRMIGAKSAGRPLAPRPPVPDAEPRNPRALFVLAPPRSGTTLLRVMLGGHPRLFAPPELELLSFATLAERRAAFSGGDGRDSFWLEGAIRAVMEAKGLSVDAARELVEAGERAGWSTGRLYAEIQSAIGDRMLVDKTPSYALDPAVLARAEETFEAPLYVHLVRHPYGMIRSFEEAKLDQLFFRQPHRFARRELAELIWLVSQENILDFLAGVPAERRHRVVFEELVARPEAALRALCAFLGLDYHPDMADPYLKRPARMTDGLHAASRMLGDVKFHQHQGVDAGAADRWRLAYPEDFLGEPTRALAAELGYDLAPADELAAPAGAIAPTPRRPGEPVPLSFAQERLWFIDRLDPGAPTYNLPSGMRIEGPLDVAALVGAVDEVVRRHEALRTTFGVEDGRPVQVIAPQGRVDLQRIDLSALPAPRREREMARLAGEEADLPFDLARGPLLRAALLTLGPAEHAAYFTLHHIVADGWSMGVLIREVSTLYDAFARRLPSPLPPLPIQYGDFALWQRRRLAGRGLAAQLDYWRRTLAGVPTLDLPADLPRPPVLSARAADAWAVLPAPLRDALSGLAERQGATLFMALLAGAAALLARWSGERDIALGSPLAGRTRPEVEPLIGFFVNTLVFRADLAGEPGFAEILGRVRRVTLGAFAHQDLPFERLVQALEPERDRSHTPLFQVMLSLANAYSEVFTLPGLQVTSLLVGKPYAKFDLELTFKEGPQGLLAGALFRADLFHRTTMVRLLDHLEVLLAAAVADPERPLSDLPLLAPAERHQLVREWRHGEPAPAAELLPARLAAIAAAAPEAVAIETAPALGKPERLTFGELARRATALARRLATAGVGPGARVGLALPRTADLPAALWGVWQAGGAYVPLDLDLPEARLAFMIADSLGPAPVLVATRALAARAEAAAPGARVVLADDLTDDEAAAGPSPAPLAGPAPEDLAYLIYTSGSTGAPKAVAVEHRQLAHALAAAQAAFGWRRGDRMPVLAPHSFDIFLLELLGPLAAGGTAVLFDPKPTLDLGALLAALPGLTVLHAVPAVMREVVDAVVRRGGGGEGLRQIFVGGDRVPAELVRDLRRAFPRAATTVLYGPTEATIVATGWTVDPVADRGERRALLGRPLPGAAVLVLDRDGSPAAIGAPGELLLAGPGVARGYLGRPKLTAERFVPGDRGELGARSPLGGELGARLYRTGDRVRWTAGGRLEFLGRVDRQVKVRGIRVELGEIEAALSSHPAVRQAAVVAEGGILVAFVVPGAGAEDVAPEALAAHLRQSLPEAMIPAAWEVVAELPLSAHGKVDRRELARRAAARWVGGPPAAAARTAPRTALERLIAEAYSEVLGRGEVGVEESFFSLGGNSLAGAHLILRLQERLGRPIEVAALFDAPTVAALAAHLLERFPDLASARPDGQGALDRLVAAGASVAPLSFAQERLWFLDRLDPGTPTYNVPSAIRFGGAFDLAAFAEALGEIARRHGTLRTTFTLSALDAGGEPVQVVAPPSERTRPQPLPVADLTALPAERREAEMRRLAFAEAARPFDLARGPLLRTALLALGPGERVILLTMHHIVSDDWSMDVLTQEITALYVAFARRRPSPLPPLPIQYADFARWQRGWLQGEVLERQIAFWKRTLAGGPVLDLPTDLPRPPVQTFHGGTVHAPFPRPLRDALAGLAERSGATLFMAYLAGLAALLGRLAGQEDVSIGFPIANRTRAETEGLIGFFANTLVLRADLSGDPGFGALLARVRDAAKEAYAHQDLPFEKVVEVLQPARDRSRTPLFQTMLTLKSQSAKPPVQKDALGLGALDLKPIAVDTESVKFDLTLSIEDRPEGARLALSYRRDLFLPATIHRTLRRYEALLAAAVAEPDRPWMELPLLDEAERQQLAEWGSGGPYAAAVAGALQDGFFAWAAAHPEDEALVWGEERVRYGDLAERASRIARRLVALGAGPETLVGVCLPRSPEMVAALLGVLAAGAAYVPLDPAYPVERLGFMLEDTRAPIVLVEADGPDLGALPGAEGCRAIDLAGPAEREAIARQSAAPLPRRTVPGNLAYVLYTSGSTGRPKGVAIEHRSVLALFAWAAPIFSRDLGIGARIGRTGGILAGTSISFDVSVFEIFFTLAHGGRVLLAENSLALPSLPARGELTLLNAVPSAVAELLRQGAVPPSVRTVNLPGEPLSGKLVDDLYALGHVERVWNLYGPSEDTTYSTYALVPKDRSSEPAIGRPIAGTAVHVLDRSMRPVPPGVAGEVYLGGAGLARGYFARPELTAERFVPHPGGEGGEPGARLYRTGDLARYRPDGELEYLGRADRQVKLRGFRIELGEIEAALRAQPGVEEAAVVLRTGASGDSELAAFYTVRQEGDPAPALRSALRARLPEPMVPAAFVLLPALPLSPNGKIDRQALSRLSPARGAAEGERVEPRGAVETALARIWEDLLGLPRVGAGDSFFELGGHSLLATRLLSRLRDAFGVELTLHQLFERPVLSDLARAVEGELAAAGGPPPQALGILPAPPGCDLPLSFAQERLWFLDRLDPGSPTYNVPTAVRFAGDLDLAAFSAAIDEVARRHASLRTTFALSRLGPDIAPVQVVAPPGRRPLPVVDLAHLPEGRREEEGYRLAAEEATRPFDLERGPLLRTAVVSLGRGTKGGQLVLLTMHHIVSDGWSMEVLTRELGALYGAFARRLPSPLPPLPIQYGDFALWQRSWLRGEVLDRQIAFWKETLGGAATLDLPADLPRPPLQTYRGRAFGEPLPGEMRSALVALAERSRATPFMVYLAGFAALLGRLAGQDDVSVGFPIANRTRSELEGLIGFFANTLVLRADLAGDPGFGALLARVRDAAKGAYAHQDIPFEKVVEVLQPARDRSRTPLFQAMFTFEGGGGRAPEAPRVAEATEATGAAEPALAPLVVPSEAVKFDLTLAVEDGAHGAAVGMAARTDLFFPTTIRRLIRQYQALVAAAVADPERPLAELPLLTAPERQQALVEWSAVAAARRPGESLPELLSQAAARSPEATAIMAPAPEGALSFAALERRVGRLAARLAALGVGPEVAVGVALSRSTAWLTALLATMRAGGVYVPLDPGYPRERLAFLLDDAGAALLVTSRAHAARLPELLPRTLFLDEAEMAALDERGPALAERPAADRAAALAYVIYTSGSTGRPKGVAVTHRGIGNLAAALVREHALSPADRVLQFASPSFDVSISEVAMALAAGAPLHLAPAAELMPGPALDRLLRERRITVTFLPPSALGAMPDPDLPDLRALLVGGEPCPLPWAERWARGRRLWNAYGPTEGTVYETLGELEAGDRLFALGRPLAGTRAYLLDRRLQPVPAGVPGHLHIGGVGLARGYFRRPELTAEAFVPDLFATEPGQRLYRTGDLARFLPDGRLEFLGRNDAQVKVRGFRVEPGEVEAALLGHPEVREAAVVARSDGGVPGKMGELVGKRLVAYVVPAPGSSPAPEALRAYLETALPPHLLPSVFVIVPELPKNAAGKIDRRLLPAPERPRLAGDTAAAAAPRTPLERMLAESWAEVLGIAAASIGRDDDFFALGGTSLQGALLLRAVEERLGAPVPVSALFEAPTVAGLARLLAGRHPEVAAALGEPTAESEAPDIAPPASEPAAPAEAALPLSPTRPPVAGLLVPIQREGEGAPFFCVHPVGGNVLCYAELARELGPGRRFYGLQSAGLAGAEPQRTIEEMAASYLDAIAAVQPRGPYLLGGWSLGGVIAYEMAQQAARRGERVDLVALIDSATPQAVGFADGDDEMEMGEMDEGELAGRLVLDLAGLSGEGVERAATELAALPPEERLEAALGYARRAGVLPPALSPEQATALARRLTAVFAANLGALRAYAPTPYAGRVVLFRAADRPAGVDPTLGWRNLLDGHLEIQPLAGDHYSLLQGPGAAALAAALGRALAPYR